MGELVEDLLNPENHPDPRPAHVQLVTTHGSWVFLTEADAWKVKRPVDYGFFDFTTIGKRLADCEAEVRLNRRLAPGVYLDVVPVRRDAKGHSLNRGGEIVDYAVRMRRLDPADSLLARLDSPTLPALLDLLASRMAAFHAAHPGKEGFGTPEVVAVNVRENLAQVEGMVGPALPAERLARVRAWQTSFLTDRADRIRRRVADGRIREGHGDLRLEHVYVDGHDLLVIDCIEFNERFRHVDQATDIAFLAMDLEVHGRRDLAEWFVARYAEYADDYGLYSVVDFHRSYLAFVRGKIGMFQNRPETAARYFELSEAATHPPSPPPLIAVGGVIAGGKSHVADALCLRGGLPVVRSDAVRKRLFGVDRGERAGSEAYSAEATRRTYEAVLDRTGAILDSGRGAVIDATFREERWRLAARDLARRHVRSFRFVEVRADDAVLRARLRAREGAGTLSDAREDLLDSFRGSWEPVAALEKKEHVILDTTRGSAAEAAGRILAEFPR